MIPEKLFQQLLVLGEAWRVKSVDYVEQESKVVIRIEERPQLWANQKCTHCEAAAVAGYDHAPERSWGRNSLSETRPQNSIQGAAMRFRCLNSGPSPTTRKRRPSPANARTATSTRL